MHRVLQDIQQVRSICQQLVASERHNAQMLSQQNGFTNMAQTETHAAQQLQQCIDICNHMEQEVHQTTMQQQAQQSASFNPMQNTYQPGSNSSLSQVMQADKQYQQQYQPQQFGQAQYQPNNAQFQPSAYNSLTQQMTQTRAPQSYAPQQHAPGLSQVMQADHANPQSPTQTTYGYRPQ